MTKSNLFFDIKQKNRTFKYLFISMNRIENIKNHQSKLSKRYKQLVEQAYNFRQTDSALSDISEYKSIKLLNKLNRLKYLSREQTEIRN
ncbi:MAG: Lacal_2735 family protein [Algibacter sp.]